MAEVRFAAGLALMLAGLLLACVLLPLAAVCDWCYETGDRLSE